MSVPTHHFVERWCPLNHRCRVDVGGRVYEVVRWTAPVRIVRFTARLDGAVVAERATFPSLLRDLARL